MATKEFKYKGKTLGELSKMGLSELADLLPARPRRSIKRGMSEDHKKLLKKIEQGKKKIKTHCKDIIVLPQMVGRLIMIHNGKEFVPVTIQEDMIGHYLGEFTLNRKETKHSAPGIGATRSSSHISVK